jgi:hypothetical protein
LSDRALSPSRFAIGSEWTSPPELYHSIGLLITQWGQLERICKQTIVLISKGDKSAADIIVSSPSSRAIIDFLRKLVHHSDPKRAKEFDQLYARLQKALGYRNEHAHASIDLYRFAELGLSNATLSRTRLRKSGLEIEKSWRATPHSVRRRALFISVVYRKMLEFAEPYYLPLEKSRTSDDKQ